MDHGRQAQMNTSTVATAVQRRWACHTRTVSPADAYGRQRCDVVLSARSVVCLWCMSWAVCSLEKATKTDKILPVRRCKIGLIQRNPGNRLTHSRKKNLERPPRELQYSDRAQTSTTGSGRPSCFNVVLGFWLKVLVRRDEFENRQKIHTCAYTYKAPLRGVG